MSRHAIQSHQPANTARKCPYPGCAHTTNRSNDLKRHVNDVHLRQYFWCLYCTKNGTQGSTITTHMRRNCANIPAVPDRKATTRKAFDARGWLWYKKWKPGFMVPEFASPFTGDATMIHERDDVVWECREGSTVPYLREPDPLVATSASLGSPPATLGASSSPVLGEAIDTFSDPSIANQVEPDLTAALGVNTNTYTPSIYSSIITPSYNATAASTFDTAPVPTGDLALFSDTAHATGSSGGANFLPSSFDQFTYGQAPQRAPSLSYSPTGQDVSACPNQLGLALAWPHTNMFDRREMGSVMTSPYPVMDGSSQSPPGAFPHQGFSYVEVQSPASYGVSFHGFDIPAASIASTSTIDAPLAFSPSSVQDLGLLLTSPLEQGMHSDNQAQPASSLVHPSDIGPIGNTNTYVHDMYQNPVANQHLQQWHQPVHHSTIVEPEVMWHVADNSEPNAIDNVVLDDNRFQPRSAYGASLRPLPDTVSFELVPPMGSD